MTTPVPLSSSLAVAPASVPDVERSSPEGTTLIAKYYEPFEFGGRIFVREYDMADGEYVATHGPFDTEYEAQVETAGLTAQEIVETFVKG